MPSAWTRATGPVRSRPSPPGPGLAREWVAGEVTRSVGATEAAETGWTTARGRSIGTRPRGRERVGRVPETAHPQTRLATARATPCSRIRYARWRNRRSGGRAWCYRGLRSTRTPPPRRRATETGTWLRRNRRRRRRRRNRRCCRRASTRSSAPPPPTSPPRGEAPCFTTRWCPVTRPWCGSGRCSECAYRTAIGGISSRFSRRTCERSSTGRVSLSEYTSANRWRADLSTAAGP
mmetsp:Transcript_5633/g.23094  ORF Transcript_5633/g.23094 Transcript_5633/m.23094 type:complete len:235 (-) Transcript_5633:658-1362(-)